MYLKPKDSIKIGISFCIILCLHIVAWRLWGDVVFAIFLPFMLGVIVFIQTDHYRSIREQFQKQDGHFRQIEALFSLFRMITPRYPPSTDGRMGNCTGFRQCPCFAYS